MSKATSRTNSQNSLLQRLSFIFFSLFRHLKNKPGGILPTVESQAIIQASDDLTFTSQGRRKEVLFFRIIEFFYLHIASTSQTIFKGIVKITKFLLSPIRNISNYLFERILDVTEWIYTFVLYPLYYRFGYLYRATLVGLKSKPLAIILFVVLSSFMIRYFLETTPRHAVVYSLIPIILILVFFNPIAGLCCYIFFGLGMLHKMIYNFPSLYTGSPLILAVVGSYAFRVMVGKEKEFCWVQNNQNLIILALWSIMTLSAYAGWNRAYFYLNFVGWFVVYFLILLVIGSNKKRFIAFLSALTFIYGVYAFKTCRQVAYHGLDTSFSITAEVKGRMADNNELAACLDMSLPLFLGFFLISKKKIIKIVLFITYITTVVAIIYTNSRGGLMGLTIVTTLILFKFILPNKKIRKKGIVLLLVLGIIGFSLFKERVGRRTESIANWQNDSSARNRIVGIFTGFAAMLDNPLFGVGSGEMRRSFVKYCPRKITFQYWFGEENKIVWHQEHVYWAEVHNVYASVGGENGLFVWILWVFMLFYGLWRHYFLRRELPKTPENEWAHILSHALEISLISYMVTGMFLSNFSEGFAYSLLAASISLEHIALRRKGKIEIVSVIWLVILFGLWAYLTYWFRFIRTGNIDMAHI
jgi:probable O-glycosylation ligase (exosortase A-associated)